MALVVSNVVKSFGQKIAVNDASFKIDKPGVFGLLGTNGAGKTTIIRMILGILNKDNGVIEWDGKPVTRETVKFGYLPEERGLYPKAKIEEQLVYFGKLRGLSAKSAKESVQKWLERLGISEYVGKTAEQLSKGNQQKIQLIAALIHDPELVILDEPLSGLDPINTDLFKGVIYELIEKGKYVVMSSHQMAQVEEYCQDILILKDGITVLSGNLNQIKKGYGRTNLFVNCKEELEQLINEESIRIIQKNALGYELKIRNEDQAYNLLEKMVARKIRPDKFEIREPSLHEIFIEKVGDKK